LSKRASSAGVKNQEIDRFELGLELRKSRFNLGGITHVGFS
jgi:hypothetical protein